MKKLLTMAAALGLLFPAHVYAEGNPGRKLLRGVVNIITAPVEIPRQARAYWIEGAYKTDHFLIWAGTGAVYGMVQTVKRAGSGVWDIASFPFEAPGGYEPLLKPDYVFEDWPSDPDVFAFHTIPKERNWK